MDTIRFNHHRSSSTIPEMGVHSLSGNGEVLNLST